MLAAVRGTRSPRACQSLAPERRGGKRRDERLTPREMFVHLTL